MLIKSIDKEIEIVIDNEFTNITFDSDVHRFPVYQTVWSPIIGDEDLERKYEKENKEDEFEIGVYRYDLKRETMVGHILRNYIQIRKFLQLPNSKLYCRVTGNKLKRGERWIRFGNPSNLQVEPAWKSN